MMAMFDHYAGGTIGTARELQRSGPVGAAPDFDILTEGGAVGSAPCAQAEAST